MEYISVKEWAGLHGVSERTARNYFNALIWTPLQAVVRATS